MKKLIVFLLGLLLSGSAWAAGTIKFGKAQLPANYRQIKIMGVGEVSQAQALKYLQKCSGGKIKVSCSAKDLVAIYFEEANKAGIRPDIALCQAMLETGSFRFGGTVGPEQNNFCGLGTTGKGVKGARFATPKEGVRAHIQHLQAYCQQKRPKDKIVDPRYELVHKIRMGKGLIHCWWGLNGVWAMSPNYCEKIMAKYYEMKNTKS